MQAQAQITIHSLNDVVTSATAPSSPYKGQLWMKSSVTPPVLYTYNGSSWVEVNGTSTLRSNVSTLTTRQSTLESNMDGLTSTVSSVTTRVTTLEDDYGTISEDVETLGSSVSTLTQTAFTLATRISDAEGNISTLQQTTDSISATVANKADASGGSQSSFGWSLTSSGFYLYSNGNTVLEATDSGISVYGHIEAESGKLGDLSITGQLTFQGNPEYYIDANRDDSSYYVYLPGLRIDEANGAVFSGNLSAPSGTIGGFTIASSKLYKTKTSYSSSTAGVYLGTDGIGLGAGTFYVTSAGYLYASNASITGEINASSGTLSQLTVTGRLYFGNNNSYYIDPNYNDGAYYINLPGFRVDDASGAVFSGNLSAPSGTIGGFTIGTNKIYKTKTTYNSSTAGVYIGNDGIGLGAGTFYVTSAGALHATNATITGTITNAASDGWGVKIINNRIEFLQNSTTVCQMFGSPSLYRADLTTTSNGLYITSLLRVGGDLVCGKCLGISTGNGIYVSGKLALTMGQIKVQTNTGKTRYLLFYCGILVGISASAYSGITDFSASTYEG